MSEEEFYQKIETIKDESFDIIIEGISRVNSFEDEEEVEDFKKELVGDLLEKLFELRTHIHENGGNDNVIDWIDNDIDTIEVLYLGQEPDGDNQVRIKEESEGELDFDEVMDIIHTRLTNT